MDRNVDVPQGGREKYASMHPLELFAFFRRYRPSALRTIIYTVIFNCIIAAFFTLMAVIFRRFHTWADFGSMVLSNLIVSNIIGFTWAAVMSMGKPLLCRINALPFPGIIASYTMLGFVVTQGAFFGISFLPGFEGMRAGAEGVGGWFRQPQMVAATLALSFFISLVIGISWRARFGALEREAAMARENERLQTIEREAAQANLRALQAQIEPHFLFNTLANVVGLIHPQPDKAKLMLEQFIVYLRATLAATREQQSTLGKEFETMKNFLSILQVRMGERLQVRMDLPPALADAQVPPMLLQPIVENALKHGLEPKIEGGEVSLSAVRQGDKLAITVTDTGLGFRDSMSNGIGLKNVRERLRHLYAEAGSLLIEDHIPGGTRITISIPYSV